jgi:hypothetical protein
MNFFGLVYDNTIGLMPEPIRTIVLIVAGVIFAIVTGFKSVQRVPAGHLGMLLFLDRVVLYYDDNLTKQEKRRQKAVDKALIARGKLARYGEPRDLPAGFRKMVPYFNKIEVVDARSRTFSLGEIQFASNEARFKGCKFPDVRIPTNVTKIYFWKYRTDEIEHRLAAIAKNELANIQRKYAPEDGVMTTKVVELITYEFLKAIYFQFTWHGAKATNLLLGTELPILEGWLAQAISEPPSEPYASERSKKLAAVTSVTATIRR